MMEISTSQLQEGMKELITSLDDYNLDMNEISERLERCSNSLQDVFNNVFDEDDSQLLSLLYRDEWNNVHLQAKKLEVIVTEFQSKVDKLSNKIESDMETIRV